MSKRSLAKAQSYVDKALNYKGKNRLENIILNLDKALSLCPPNETAKYSEITVMKSYALAETREFDKALACIDEFLSRGEDQQCCNAKAKILLLVGRNKEADAWLKTLKTVDVTAFKMSVLMRQGLWREAVDLAGDNKSFDVMFNKASALASLKEFKAALAVVEEAAKTATPEENEALSGRKAFLLLRTGKYTELEAVSNKVSRESLAGIEAHFAFDDLTFNPFTLDPTFNALMQRFFQLEVGGKKLSNLEAKVPPWDAGYPDRYQSLSRDFSSEIDPFYLNAKGSYLCRCKQFPEALECLDRALEIYPNHPAALYSKAITLTYQEKFDEALSIFDKLESDPVFITFSKRLEFKAEALKRISVEKAPVLLQCLDEILDKQPDSRVSLIRKSAVLNLLGRYKESIACVDRVISMRSHYEASFQKGIALWGLGDIKGALACFDIPTGKANTAGNGRSLNKSVVPDHYATKGDLLLLIGEYNLAIECYDEALQLRPDDCTTIRNKGIALLRLNKLEDAKQQFQKSLEKCPHHPYTLTLLASTWPSEAKRFENDSLRVLKN